MFGGLAEVGGPVEVIHRRAIGQTDLLEARPGGFQYAHQRVVFGRQVQVAGNFVALCQKVRRPDEKNADRPGSVGVDLSFLRQPTEGEVGDALGELG